MTGYGTVSRVFREGRLSIELKTLNGRFFDLTYKAPREFSLFEPKIIEELKKVFARGSIEMIVSWQAGGRGEREYHELNRSLISHYLKTIHATQKKLKIPGTLTLDRVLSLPNAWVASTRSFDRAAYWKIFQLALKQCVARVERMRNREGATLSRMLRKQLFDLKKEVELLIALRDQWVQKYEARLKERIRTYLDDKSFDAARLHQEAAVLISRTDIHEELDRLKSHLSQFFSTISSTGEIGKKLDFLLQEMNREVNTIGSKTQDSLISSLVIRMKSLIEKLKEQTQNVE